MKLQKNQVILHGECKVTVASEIPAGAKRLNTAGKPFEIVAPSETTGNHHVVTLEPGVEFYEHDGKKYMNSVVPTQIKCVIANRHDAIDLAPGTYEFGSQMEYDPFTARLNKVRD